MGRRQGEGIKWLYGAVRRFNMNRLIEGEDYQKVIPAHCEGMKFMTLRECSYHSPRYNRWIVAHQGFFWNGADWVDDLEDEGTMSSAPMYHDVLCRYAIWDDGTPVSNWQASRVLRDILSAEGRSVRKRTWFWFTFLLGGNKIKRENSWF
jgi:hypothetical protein